VALTLGNRRPAAANCHAHVEMTLFWITVPMSEVRGQRRRHLDREAREAAVPDWCLTTE